jgi:predicted acetyltransferase/SAM-dependent methyltransferase
VSEPLVVLEPVAEEDKAVLANLLQLYRHDLSEFLHYELSEHGTYVYRFLDHYWSEPGRHAFFIRVDRHLAGFALARDVDGEHEVAEFFVVRRHRHRGVGLEAALALFARLPGRWSLFHDNANEAAGRFWKEVVERASGGNFEHERLISPAGIVGQQYRFAVEAEATGEAGEAGAMGEPGEPAYIPLPSDLADPRTTAARVFDRIADLYDRARPGYPAEVVAELVRTCAITSDSSIIEIGCGTGQLTRDLAPTGASILAIEPGESLAALARANLAAYPTVDVMTCSAEDFDGTAAGADVVAAATSFHWIDPNVGYRKAADLLRRGGHLALLTHVHARGGTDTEEGFSERARELHRRLAPRIGDWYFPPLEELVQRATAGGDIAAVWTRLERRFVDPPDVSDLFEAPQVVTYPWLATYDRDGYLDWVASQSVYALLEPEQRAQLLAELGRLIDELLGGQVTKQYVTVLATAERR